MKLRNKKTGEIVNLLEIIRLNDKFYLRLSDNEGRTFKVGFNSLTKLDEEWQDYEAGYYKFTPALLDNRIVALIVDEKASREEARKLMVKLKAYKRLKDKGFRIDRWCNVSAGPYRPVWFYFEKDTALEDVKSDLDLLFGGEE